MGNESGEWIIHGLSRDDPERIKTVEDLLALIDRVYFLPLFRTEIPGFSVEEHTLAEDWWSGDPDVDPWEWREQLARSRRVVYGHFFRRKAGFVSLKAFPAFMNVRRDGYPFDALWDDGKASFREKKIMDCFDGDKLLFSTELKEKAGFLKGGERNFEGTVQALMDKTYLCVADYRQRMNRQGFPYGWPIGVYARPETLFGEDSLYRGYENDPAADRKRLTELLFDLYPGIPPEIVRQYI